MARTILSCLGLGLAAAAATGATAGLSTVASPEAVAAAAALGGLAGNLLTDLCKVLHRPVAERWLEGRSGIDENHRVASALRLAQLKALGVVRDRFDTTWPSLGDPAQRQAAERFSLALKRFLDAETTTAKRAGFDADRDLAADDLALRDAVLKELPDVFDASLAARRAAGDKAALLESLRCLRAALENAILAEIRLRTATPDKDRPTAFLWAFDGSGFPDSWFDLFVRDAASRLDEAGFAAVWHAEQLALVKAIGEANSAALAAIGQGVGRIEQGVTGIQGTLAEQAASLEKFAGVTQALVDALGENKELSQRLQAANVDKAKVMALARRTAQNVDDFDQALRELENHANVAIEVSREGQGSHNLGAFVEAVLARIRARYDANDFDAAAAEASKGFDAWQQRETERRAEAAQAGLTILNAGLRQDILRRDPVAAAERIELIAGIESPENATALLRALRTSYDEWYERGCDRGLNFDLQIAIEIARRALKMTRTMDERGVSHILLGLALWTLGERESGTVRLEQAVVAYRAALEECTRDRVPLDWATTQNNLGNALLALGRRESGTARLEQAVAAFRAALEERTRDRVPLDWAMTQNNLGNALLALGRRESGTARLEQAVAAYRAALEEMTRDRVPLDWAATQNNLGNALAALGGRESGTARLEQAVSAYRAALAERTRDRVALGWAVTQNNLGNALATLGGRESGTAWLEQAVAAYRAALEEMTRDRVPLDWAATQTNLGAALRTLGERESGTTRLEEAVAAYHAALEERTRDRVPLDWAMTQNNLGLVLATLGERESGTARLEQAMSAYRAALEEWTRDRVPLNWATAQNNLGNALQTLGQRESGTARLEQAVAAYRAALEEQTRDRVPLGWAMSFGNQGVALMHLADRRDDAAMAETALRQIETARDVTRDGGHAVNAVYYESQLLNARAVLGRLRAG